MPWQAVRSSWLPFPAVLLRTALGGLFAFAGFSAPPASARLPDPLPKRVAMRVPLDGPLQSGFGYRWGRMHWGVDLDAYSNTVVRSALPGVVTRVGWLQNYSGYGRVVIIRHRGRLKTMYAHLARALVGPGEPVPVGEVIGVAGCTGSCTGTHLHFEVHLRGRAVDPLRYLGRSVRR
jgi:murein DD-endopeptidase MepM/ murein hydrolase activator NlpD